MAKHAIVRTDNMYGTDVRAGLVSVKFLGEDGSTPAEIDNGHVLKIGELVEGEREVYQGLVPAAGDDLGKIVLVASPEVMYEDGKHSLDNYFNVEGKICRGYHLHTGDTFSVTKEALAGVEAPEVGNAVELAAGTKLSVAAAATDESTQVGRIIAVDIVGPHTFYAIKVN